MLKLGMVNQFTFSKIETEKKKKENSLFSVDNPLGVKLLAHLTQQFSHLNGHKFRYDFNDKVSLICGCHAEIEKTEHFLLHCYFHSAQRFELFNNINKVDYSFTQLGINKQVNILLNSYLPNKSNILNQDIIKFVINFLTKSGRFINHYPVLKCSCDNNRLRNWYWHQKLLVFIKTVFYEQRLQAAKSFKMIPLHW